jgi:predicted metalloprotease with PDZ domain
VLQGLFVALVQKNSPAALAGLRFGDQILTINGQTMAGWDNDKAHNFIRKLDPQRITMAVRDRSVVCLLLDAHTHRSILGAAGQLFGYCLTPTDSEAY